MSEEPSRRRQREGEEEETGAQKTADAVAEVAEDDKEVAQKALDEEFLDSCLFGTREHVEEALKKGANLITTDTTAQTGLMLACWREDWSEALPIAKLLLRKSSLFCLLTSTVGTHCTSRVGFRHWRWSSSWCRRAPGR